MDDIGRVRKEYSTTKVNICKEECKDFLAMSPGKNFRDYKKIKNEVYSNNFRLTDLPPYSILWKHPRRTDWYGIFGKCNYCQLWKECLTKEDCKPRERCVTDSINFHWAASPKRCLIDRSWAYLSTGLTHILHHTLILGVFISSTLK